jgi:glycerol uptake facilitator protein
MNPLIAEFIGTTILLIFGSGVVANVSLKNTYGSGNPSWIIITTAWGLAVFTAVFITGQFSGAHLNPAVTLGLAFIGKFDWTLVIPYMAAQLAGAMLGSWLVYLFYWNHFKQTDDEHTVKGVFCTSPAIRNFPINLFNETLGTFMLVFGVFFIVGPTIDINGVEVNGFGLGSLDALPVGLLVWVIGLSLGGTTGYAINPARDFGPRLVFFLIPRKNKVSVDWQYAIIPILGPMAGAILAGILFLSIR